MKKVILTIIGSAFLAMGFLGSSAAISDDTNVDDVLIAKGGIGEQMACWGKLQVCLTKEGKDEINLRNPLNATVPLDDSECDAVCNPENGFNIKCTHGLCYERCRTAYAIPESSDICDAPSEFASLMDLLKKSPVVASLPKEEEAEALDPT